MKKIILTLMLIAPQLMAEEIKIGKGLSIPSGIKASPVAVREYVNGQWLAGFGFDILYWQIPGTIKGKPWPKLYLAVNHTYNADELFNAPSKAAGLWGPAVGISIGGFATKAMTAINDALNFVHDIGGPYFNPPPWLINDLDKWVTVELGGGYRIFGHNADVPPWGATVGGKVSITFDLTAHH